MLSPAETVIESAPAALADARSVAKTAARREAPPLMPEPLAAGVGKSSTSGPRPIRCECSSLVWRMTSLRGDLLPLHASASALSRTRERRMDDSPGKEKTARRNAPWRRSVKRPDQCAPGSRSPARTATGNTFSRGGMGQLYKGENAHVGL